MSDDLRFSARSAGGAAESDPARRGATIRVTRALAADRARCSTRCWRRPCSRDLVLTTAIPCTPPPWRRGHAVLLAAPSGTGKSTLAYACHSAGLDLLGDDHVRVQLAPAIRIWGWPPREAPRRDRGADGRRWAPIGSANGKTKAVIDARRDVGAGRLVASSATVCVLARDGGAVSLSRCRRCARAALEAQLAPGFDRFPRAGRTSCARYTERGAGGSISRATRTTRCRSCGRCSGCRRSDEHAPVRRSFSEGRRNGEARGPREATTPNGWILDPKVFPRSRGCSGAVLEKQARTGEQFSAPLSPSAPLRETPAHGARDASRSE